MRRRQNYLSIPVHGWFLASPLFSRSMVLSVSVGSNDKNWFLDAGNG
jgi:hypothetical protein